MSAVVINPFIHRVMAFPISDHNKLLARKASQFPVQIRPQSSALVQAAPGQAHADLGIPAGPLRQTRPIPVCRHSYRHQGDDPYHCDPCRLPAWLPLPKVAHGL